MPSTTGKGRRQITPDKIDHIITLRLAGISERETARQVGVTRETVVRHYGDYLDDTAADRAEHLERQRSRAYIRLWQVADKAAETAELAVEVRALAELTKVLGMQQVHVHSTVEHLRLPTQEEAAAAIAKLPRKLRAV